MSTDVQVYSHSNRCSAYPVATGVTVSNGDTLEITVPADDDWYVITNGLSGCESFDYVDADGATCTDPVYDSCSGLTANFGALAGLLGGEYFLVGTSYSVVVSGLSGSQELYLFQHGTFFNEEVYDWITATITVTPGGGGEPPATNSIMFSCNT